MSEDEEPASPTAQLMQEPRFNLCILVVMGFETRIDVRLLKKGLEQRLLKHPRFSSVLAVDKKSNNFSWKRALVDLENHIFAPDLDPDMESPEAFLENFTSTLSRTPMDLLKPLWELHILNIKTPHAKSIAVFKIHHSIGDGVSLISLILACAKKTSDPESLPALPMSKKRRKLVATRDGMLITRFFFRIWAMCLIVFNTLIDCVMFLATILFLEDTKTPIKGSRGVEHSPKKFVHRIVSLDDVKLVKNAMNVSVNDVILGVTEAGISRYLNMRHEKHRENGGEFILMNNRKPRLRLGIVVNLRRPPTIEALAETMEKGRELNRKWGNLVGFTVIPLTIDLQDDPLAYIRRAKATMDRKKQSLGPICSYLVVKILVKLFGIKAAGAVVNALFSGLTLGFSNVAGPQEEIILFGHPLSYIAPTVSGFPLAQIIHYQSYANKLIISLAADEKLIPDPHQLCEDFVKSLENIKEAVTKRGLFKGSKFD